MYCGNCGASNAETTKFCVKCGAEMPAPGSAAAGAPATASGPLPYAGFWRRFAAYVIDYFVIAGIGAACLAVSALAFGKSPLVVLAYVLALCGGWLYSALMWSSSSQATIGKLALGIKVTSLGGERIGFGQATGRYFAQIPTWFTLGIGYALAVLTSRRQALHDMIAGTLVVRSGVTPGEIAASPPAKSQPWWIAVPLSIAIVLLNPMGIGILAAIAIPAYQSYTIRAQVAEGLVNSGDYKAAVAAAIADGTATADISSESLHLTAPPEARYVADIKVVRSAIVVEYGRMANKAIAGKVLVITPGTTEGGAVVWVCGTKAPPDGVTMAIRNAARYTSVPAQYLPLACHA